MAPGTSELDKKLSAMRSSKEATLLAEVDVQVELERMAKIMDATLQKLKIALSVPRLVENDFKLLRPLVEKGEASSSLLEELEEYTKLGVEPKETNRHTSFFYASSVYSLENIINNYQPDKSPFGVREHAKLCEILQALLANPKILRICSRRQKCMSKAASQVTQNMEHLFRLAVQRLKTSPEEEHDNERELSKMYAEKETLEDEIGELKAQLDRERGETERELALMDRRVERITRETEGIRKSTLDSIDQYTREVERKMEWDWKESEHRQEISSAQLKQSNAELEAFLNKNLQLEKELRVKRYKTESQLRALIAKFDTDSADRRKSIAEFKEATSRKEEDLRLTQEKFDEQEREYIMLMTEKAEFEKMELDAKMYLIQCSIAARKIQRYFRYYVQLQLQYGKPKKAKKGKKKKKK